MRPPVDTTKRVPADTARRAPSDTGVRAAHAPAATPTAAPTAAPGSAIPDAALPRAAGDSTRGDSTPVKKVPKDTIKAPLARSFAPRSLDVTPNGWHWDRDSLFASGALTLGDLLARVPGITLFSTGFVLAPQAAAWYGNPGGIRLYVDGVELDPVNVRNGGIPDLSVFPIWTLEDVLVERSAGELRVHMRTWRVDRTTPTTRTDVMTGSENLNFYRGFFGRRFANGLALQAGAQQLTTTSRTGMDGDALTAFGRLGWARGSWSVDLTLLRNGMNRSSGNRFVNTESPATAAMPALSGAEQLLYARIAWRDPQSGGPWAQFIAATIKGGGKDSIPQSNIGATGGSTGTTTGTTSTGSIDSTTSRSEYTFAAGFTKWGLRLSTIDRVRPLNKTYVVSPGLRAEYDWKILSLAAAFDRTADPDVLVRLQTDTTTKIDDIKDSVTKKTIGKDTVVTISTRRINKTPQTSHTDAWARLTPFSWLQFGAAWSRIAPQDTVNIPPSVTTRIEAAVRWRDRWLSVGRITRGLTTLAPPIELDTSLRSVIDNKTSGITLGVRGPIAWGWTFDVQGVHWDAASWYRPQSELRSTIQFSSGFLDHFPRGNFHLLVAGTHEYRGPYFIYGDSATRLTEQPGYSVIGALLEVRIGDATVTYQVRNPVGTIYYPYPGYVAPRIVNMYGIRWSFWN